ncbi:MAG: hypothetical protein HY835_04080 [Anaerolineae bacterium]|nr:hypothetical protein [Anaerolineae bacterium]
MKTNTGWSGRGQSVGRHILSWPATRVGWWAFGLFSIFVVMWLINTFVFMPTASVDEAPWRQIILPFYGIFMMLSGLSAGVVGLLGVIRAHERSWLVWLALLPGAFVLFFLLGEFLIPH